MNNENKEKSYLEFEPEELTDKPISELTTKPFIIANQDILHIAEFQVIGDNKIKISLPEFTGIHLENFVNKDPYLGAILYIAEIELIIEIVSMNTHDMDNSKLYFINSKKMASEFILEESKFNRVAQTYERIYLSSINMKPKYVNAYFNKYNLFAFSDWHPYVYNQIAFDNTYCDLEYDDIIKINVQQNLSAQLNNWKDKPFRLNSSNVFKNLSVRVVEYLEDNTSRVYLDYKVRDTDFPSLDGNKSKIDNNLLYDSFKLWSLIKALEEFVDQDIFEPNSQVHFSGKDSLEFSAIVEANKLNELLLKITELEKGIRIRQKMLFGEYLTNFKLDNMFK